MHIKIVGKVGGARRERIFTCEHIEVTHFPKEGSPERVNFAPDQLGVEVQCVPGPTLRIPRDGDVIYQMNDQGDTVHTYRPTSTLQDQLNSSAEARRQQTKQGVG